MGIYQFIVITVKAMADVKHYCAACEKMLARLGIINPQAAQRLGREFEARQFPKRTHGPAHPRRGARHDAAQGNPAYQRLADEARELRFCFPGGPGVRRDVGLPRHATVVSQTDVRIRVADVEE